MLRPLDPVGMDGWMDRCVHDGWIDMCMMDVSTCQMLNGEMVKFTCESGL